MCGSIRSSGCGCTGDGRRGRRGERGCIDGLQRPAKAELELGTSGFLPRSSHPRNPQLHFVFMSTYSGRIKSSYENIRTNRGAGEAVFAGNLQPLSHRVDAGEGRVSLRPRRQALSRLCFWAGGECAGARASADREDDSGAGGEADSRLQSLLPRVSRRAGGEAVHAGRRSSGNARAFFQNSGTEAIEGSIKLARLAGHRAGGEAKSRLVALEGSYHGRTFGALSLTGQEKHRKGFEPMLEEVTFVAQNDVEGLRAAVNDNTCAIVLEPIFGEGGIYECSVEFLQECRAAADRHKAALIFDEIQCGLGRTGTMFAFQTFWRDSGYCGDCEADCGGACRWERLSRRKNLLTRFRRGSMGRRLGVVRWLAGWRWSFWRLWKMRSCWTM